MRFDAFIGSSYQSDALPAAAQVCRNWYLRRIGATHERVKKILLPTPGLSTFGNGLPHGPGRGCFYQDGRMFAVGGDRFYEVYADGSYTERGRVAMAGTLASLCSNGTAGHQVFIVSGGYGYIFDLVTSEFTMVTSPGFPSGAAVMARFSDQYFFVLRAGSRTFHISNLADGSMWDTLDLAETSQGSDNLVSFDIERRLLWLYGTKTTEVWVNSGNADFPYEPLPGVFLEDGIAGTEARGRFEGATIWISRNEQGEGIVRVAVGYNPVRISTHPIEVAMQGYERIDDAECFPYQADGHVHFIMNFPTPMKTWVLDATTREWHERSWYNPASGSDEHIRPRAHCYAFGKHLVMDRENGNLYEMGSQFTTDNDDPIRRVRRSPHLCTEQRRNTYDWFRLQVETGFSNPVAADGVPLVGCRCSDDGAKTWSDEIMESAGEVGDYTKIVEWARLGDAIDRVFEVTTIEPLKIIDASLGVTAGVH